MVLVHPTGHAEPLTMACIVGGPALYPLGNLIFKRLSGGSFQLSHLGGLAALAALGAAATLTTPLALSLVSSAVLATVAVWETVSLGGSGSRSHAAPVATH